MAPKLQHQITPPEMSQQDLEDNVEAHHFGLLENTATHMESYVGTPDPNYGRLKE